MMEIPEPQDSDDLKDLIDIVFDILAPHALYLRDGRTDHSRHYFGPEALEALSNTIVKIAVPILTGVATSSINEWLKRRREPRPGDSTIARPDAVVSAHDDALRAEAALTERLIERGWPAEVAQTDAKAIVRTLLSPQS
jgi:hypothetical protein